MAQSQTGKWVARVASTGGGRTYRKQRPNGFYIAVAVIVVLGLLSVALARHNYRSAGVTTTTSGEAPAVGTTSYASLAFDVCGSLAPSLAASAAGSKSAFTAEDGGVLKIAPKTAAEAGANATLAAFASDYPGLTVTSSRLGMPANGSTAALALSNGDACPAGSPDAGKKGKIVIARWKNYATDKSETTTDPSKVRLVGNEMITVGFVPAGATVLKPSTDTRDKMLQAKQQPATTTTSSPAGSSTTVPVTPTTGKN